MPHFRTLTIAAALATATAFPASAITVADSKIVSGVGELTDTNGLGFDWDDTPFAGYFDFNVDTDFDLTLSRYGENDNPITSDVSGFTLDYFDDSFGGSSTRLTTATNNCDDAADPVGGTCNMIGLLDDNVAKPGDTLFSGLSAGNYRLGFFDSQDPKAGYAEFAVEADLSPVPLPAGGFLLVGAMGGLAALKRRRKPA